MGTKTVSIRNDTCELRNFGYSELLSVYRLKIMVPKLGVSM
ncbi:hypothetical protein [Methanosarcina sp. DH1]|nr:hypothetical protein [Methanosarcina sp. DH1]